MFGLSGGFGLVGVGFGLGDVGFVFGVLICWWFEIIELLLLCFLLFGIEGGG